MKKTEKGKKQKKEKKKTMVIDCDKFMSLLDTERKFKILYQALVGYNEAMKMLEDSETQEDRM